MNSDVLVDLVDLYERMHEPMGYPGQVAAIEFGMEQAGLSPRDLVPFLGSRARVADVLSGTRAITVPMARVLHEHLGIPADVLLRTSENTRDQRPALTAPSSGSAKAGRRPRCHCFDWLDNFRFRLQAAVASRHGRGFAAVPVTGGCFIALP